MSIETTEAPSPADVLRELARAQRELANAQTFNNRLWTHADVAMFLGFNVDYCRKNIATRSDFPAPLMIPGSGKEPNARYLAEDVREWAEKWRA